MAQQVECYWQPKALHCERVASRLRRSGEVLGGCAVLLGARAASFGVGGLAPWVPAVTTVSASLTAHIGASRYDHQIVEFLRTAEQLERLQDTGAAEAMADVTFVDACQEVISVENQAWMMHWRRAPEPEARSGCAEIIRSTCAMRLSTSKPLDILACLGDSKRK